MLHAIHNMPLKMADGWCRYGKLFDFDANTGQPSLELLMLRDSVGEPRRVAAESFALTPTVKRTCAGSVANSQGLRLA